MRYIIVRYYASVPTLNDGDSVYQQNGYRLNGHQSSTSRGVLTMPIDAGRFAHSVGSSTTVTGLDQAAHISYLVGPFYGNMQHIFVPKKHLHFTLQHMHTYVCICYYTYYT